MCKTMQNDIFANNSYHHMIEIVCLPLLNPYDA